MKTPIDMVNEIFTILNTGTVKPILKGGIYKFTRPDNVSTEHFVINSLAIIGRQLQEGVANANLYVPNLKLTIDGKPDNSQPDTVRLSLLAKAAYADLDNNWKDNKLIDIASGEALQAPDLNAHFINIRINYKFFNF